MKKIIILSTMLFITLCSNAQPLSKGYRCYSDLGYSVGLGTYDFGRLEINTSHGYQFSRYFYIGAGLGLHFMEEYNSDDKIGRYAFETRDSKVDVPIFANVRGMLGKSKCSPFADLKLGTYVTNGGGQYANLSCGCRFELNSGYGINLSIGYSTSDLEFEMLGFTTYRYDMYYYREAIKRNSETLCFKVGVDF